MPELPDLAVYLEHRDAGEAFLARPAASFSPTVRCRGC